MSVGTHKLLIIGIDGADYEYISDRLSDGGMPVLAGLAREGSFGLLRSTIPPVSSPAWPTMTTGLSPGNLGLFDLTVPDGYGKRIVSARDVAVPRIWDYVGANGGRSVVMNVPVTWPPRPIEGVFVSGFLSPQGAPYTWPPALAEELEDRFAYSPAHMTSKRAKRGAMRRRVEAFLHLIETHPWDAAMVVFSATDWVQHSSWTDRPFIDDIFSEVDAALGRIIRRAGAENVAVISDHGFTGAGKVLNLNRLLANLGYLRYGTGRGSGLYAPNSVLLHGEARRGVLKSALRRLVSPRKVLALLHRLGLERALDLVPGFLWHWLKSMLGAWDTPIDWSATRAYLYNGLPQTVCLNLEGREREGIVKPADYESARAELIPLLREATDPLDGGPIISGLMTREEAFPGRYMERAPDLVFDVRDDAYLVSPADHPAVVWRTGKQHGRHRSSGIYVLHGPAFRPGASAEARLLDMTPTLLCAAGCAPPAGIDGRVATELLADDAAIPPRQYDLSVTETAEGDGDTESVRRRLRDLGYL